VGSGKWGQGSGFLKLDGELIALLKTSIDDKNLAGRAFRAKTGEKTQEGRYYPTL
jgi:hypothetical protein